ncbi:glycosyltransferase [Paraglaciecola chathamensis]|uniref:Glycosyltransferase n=1 Tax=Paraglaciecola chathamensis TaxID=368405 RepID=A0A8H9IG24_9ALTE|nr:glycosyltransferase [Paraglaciecola oceanifecundans]AEE24251.1 glycosyl transferase group 1 [Glaciecola sp. 4H-3-7+YE-5]GGZ66362.1 hypothetical protein GCM10011274_26060 [Paraglaciecola oceanifecundans]
MGNKKVLFLHKWFSLSGGVERVHQNLSNALASEGITSEFYVYDITGDKKAGYDKLIESKTATHPVQSDSFLKKLAHLFAHIKAQEIEVIIAATETANILAAFCAIRFPKLSVVYTRHCAFDVSDQKLSPAKIKLLYNFYSLTGGAIVTVSGSLQQELLSNIKLGRKHVEFIPNAVVDEKVIEKSQLNTDNFVSSDYFCAVGRLVEQKGFDMLIQAYAQARQKNNDLPKLIVVGIGDLLTELTQLAESLNIKEYVEFYGFTDNPYYIIRNAQAFILSSRHEGMPTALVEAMYLNTPVIAFDCPTGPSELIENGKNGFLVEANNVDKLADAISKYKQLHGKEIAQSVSAFEYQSVARRYINEFSG